MTSTTAPVRLLPSAAAELFDDMAPQSTSGFRPRGSAAAPRRRSTDAAASALTSALLRQSGGSDAGQAGSEDAGVARGGEAHQDAREVGGGG